ncbi:unnamed protein product [Closterium sp. NIES-54]
MPWAAKQGLNSGLAHSEPSSGRRNLVVSRELICASSICRIVRAASPRGLRPLARGEHASARSMRTGGTFQEIVAVAVSLGGLWALLLAQQFPPAVNQVLLILPVYAFVTLGCYAVGALGYGLMRFPTCPHEGALLRQDIVEAKEYLSKHGLQ